MKASSGLRASATHEAVRAEQIRLIYSMVGMTVFPAISVACIMAWVVGGREAGLPNPSGLSLIYGWLVLIVACKLFQLVDARRQLARDDFGRDVPGQIVKLMVVHGVDAASWALLVWIALDGASLTQAILVIAVISGVVGGAVSLLSPVLKVFAVYAIMDLGIIVPKFLTMGDPAYVGLAIVMVPYIISMSLQARSSSQQTRRTIMLGFENVGLMNDLAQEAERANAASGEALEANLAKSKFLAAASHDLRQPIHALGLFLEVLDRNTIAPDQRQVIANAKSAAAASTEMLNALLDFSRAEAGVIVPRYRTFCVQELLNGIETELAVLADAKRLHYRTRESGLYIRSDPALVQLILRNLILNAINYTNDGGVLVGCRRRPDGVVLEVWDTGVGVPPDHQAEIFREFHQLGNPERDRRKGLGLGLAIALRLAAMLGGTLTVGSRPGRGSVFRLQLQTPVSLSPTDAQEPALAALALPGVRQGEKARILVLDDDEAIRAGMAALIGDWGYACRTAERIEEASELARLQPPDLLICDFRLREHESGAQAVMRLRDVLGEETPAILVTGDTSPERLREAAASNLPILHKPVSPERLKTMIETLLPQPIGADLIH